MLPCQLWYKTIYIVMYDHTYPEAIIANCLN